MKSRDVVLRDLEQFRRALLLELEIAELPDTEYRQWLRDRGYETEGARWPRPEIEAWLSRLDRLLAECQRRHDDEAFFDVVRWYGTAKFAAADERLQRYSERWMPAIKTGAKIRTKARQGNLERGEQTRRLAAEKWQPRVNEIIAKNPRVSWLQVCRKVAAEMKSSRTTIDTYCTDPRRK